MTAVVPHPQRKQGGHDQDSSEKDPSEKAKRLRSRLTTISGSCSCCVSSSEKARRQLRSANGGSTCRMYWCQARNHAEFDGVCAMKEWHQAIKPNDRMAPTGYWWIQECWDAIIIRRNKMYQASDRGIWTDRGVYCLQARDCRNWWHSQYHTICLMFHGCWDIAESWWRVGRVIGKLPSAVLLSDGWDKRCCK